METRLDHEIACLIDLIRHQYFCINGVSHTVDCYGNNQLRARNDGSLQAVLFAQQLLQRCNSTIESTILELNQMIVQNGCTGIEIYAWRVAMPSSLMDCRMTAAAIIHDAKIANQRLNETNANVAYLKSKERELQDRNKELELQLQGYRTKEDLKCRQRLKLRLRPYTYSGAKRKEGQLHLRESDTEEYNLSAYLLRLQNIELESEIKDKDMTINLVAGLAEESCPRIWNIISQNRSEFQRRKSDKQNMDQLVQDLNDRIETLGIENSNLHSTIKLTDGRFQELQNWIESLGKENNTLHLTIREKDGQIQELSTTLNELQRRTECQVQEYSCLNSIIRQKDRKILELSQTLKETQKRNEELENEVRICKDNVQLKAEELETKNKRNEKLCTRNEELEKEVRICKDNLKLKAEELETKNKSNERLYMRNEELEKEVRSCKDDLQLKAEELETVKQNNEKIFTRNEELEKEARSCTNILQLKVEELENMKQNKEKLSARIDQLQKEISHCGRGLQLKEEILEKANQEKEELLTRLSQYTSAQLIQDNPNVADLSDINRPTKLAEKFSELYDNEWTDGFEVLTDTFKFTEIQAIQHLLDILMAAYRYCLDTSDKQDKMLKNALMCPGSIDKAGGLPTVLDSVQLRTIADLRKQTSHNSVKSVQKGFLEDLRTSELNSPDVTSYQKYISQCVDLCWHMVIRSPPLMLDGSVSKGDEFDKNRYKFYQTSGLHYDYVVWPPLLLHENGPLLSKGIAEGLKRKS